MPGQGDDCPGMTLPLAFDGIRWHPFSVVDKYSPDQVRYAREHGEVVSLRRLALPPRRVLTGDLMRLLFREPEGGTVYDEGNGVVTAGAVNLALVLTGAGGCPLAPGRVVFGVGSNAVAFDKEHVHLAHATGEEPGRSWYRPMDYGYPVVPRPGVIGGQATFTEHEACFAWHEWCTTSMTEMLTRAGWKTYRDLVVGEDVLTLDCVAGTSRWQPLIDVHVWPKRVRRMLVMDSARGLRSVTTADHRWPVLQSAAVLPSWTTSADLAPGVSFIRAVPHSGFPDQPKYADAFVRLVAHYWCDGWLTWRNRPTPQGGMGASRPDKVASMRSALRALPAGSWGETFRQSDGTTLFRLGKAAVAELQEAAPGKLPSYAFLADLTESQLRLFVDTCLDHGDGGEDGGRGKSSYFAQTDKHGDGVGRFQFACALLGIATNTRESSPSAGRFTSRPVHKVRVLKRTLLPVAETGDLTWEDIDDTVWCPQTPDTTWLARDRGSVYWTGNCWGSGPVDPAPHHSLTGAYGGEQPVMMNRKAHPAGYGVKDPGVAWCFRSEITIGG
jgi:hypothetical protein